MKIVCAYTDLRPETKAALNRSGYPVEYVDVSGSDLAYSHLIAKLWAQGIGWLNCEHDIVIPQKTLKDMLRCDCSFGAAPYEWGTNLGPALGATKFGEDVLAAYPHAAEEALGGSWRQYDYTLMRTILAKKHNARPHLHLPPAIHLNADKSPLASPFDKLSIDEHLAALGWTRDSEVTAVYTGGAYG